MARINAVADEVVNVEAVSKFVESGLSPNTTVPSVRENSGAVVLNTEVWNYNTNTRQFPHKGRRSKNHPTNTPPKGDYRRYRPNYNNKTNTYNLGQVWLTEDYKFASFDEGFSGRLSAGCGGESKFVDTAIKNAKSEERVLNAIYYYYRDLPELIFKKTN